MDDAELVDGLLSGKAHYQLALLDQYQDRVTEYLIRLQLLNEDDAEDITVEILERLILDPSIIDLSKSRGSLDGLVFKIARNKAIDLHRKRKKAFGGETTLRLDTTRDNVEAIMDEGQIIDRRPWHGSTGKNHVIAPEVMTEVRLLLENLNLSKEQFEHLRLRQIEKLEPMEIAEFLRITTNNERVRWHRIWKKIKDEWGKYPRLVEYAKQIGVLDVKTAPQQPGS
jgi:RNA polymerase sigma factor (sigma-70 family)